MSWFCSKIICSINELDDDDDDDDLSTAALRILDRSVHRLCDCELNIMLVTCTVMDEVTSTENEALSCAIEVHDIAPGAKEEILKMFFENRKRSGGDPIEELIYYDEEHRAVITFAGPEGMIDPAFIHESCMSENITVHLLMI